MNLKNQVVKANLLNTKKYLKAKKYQITPTARV